MKWECQLSIKDRELLKSLPLFQTYDQSGFKKVHFASVDTVSVAVSRQCSMPVAIPCVVLHLKDYHSQVLAKMLEVKLLNDAEICVKFIFPEIRDNRSRKYDTTDITNVMKFILQNLYKLKHQMDHFTNQVKKVKFICFNKATPDILQSPDNLLDNNDQLLKRVFAGQDVFPCGEFSKVCYQTDLLSVGLKCREDIKLADLLSIAKNLNNQNIGNQQQRQTASALMKLLNDVVARAPKKEISLEKFENINWVIPQKRSFCGLSRMVEVRW